MPAFHDGIQGGLAPLLKAGAVPPPLASVSAPWSTPNMLPPTPVSREEGVWVWGVVNPPLPPPKPQTSLRFWRGEGLPPPSLPPTTHPQTGN